MHLFFYGVLLEGLGEWPFLNGIGPARRATTTGTLYGIGEANGWHPALLPGEETIVGAVHEAGGANIAQMDVFEGPDYARTPIPVDVDGTKIEAEAYLWIAPLPDGALRIAHGDFARWLAETGRSPLSG